MLHKKRGAAAASTIGILILLFIFYILFLPPEAREELLEGDGTTLPGDGEAIAKEVLLQEAVGRLAPQGQTRFDHHIPNLFLAESRNAEQLARENPFTIHKGLFSEQQHTFTFTLDRLDRTENVLLSYQTLKRSGRLHIVLNGHELFQGTIARQSPPPLRLPKSLLEETNTITFFVTGGWMQHKEYALTNIQVIGDITDVSKQQATNTFQISQVEYDNLEHSWLDFHPLCEQGDVGIMTITLNGRTIYSAVPACESANRQELYREDLTSGKNTLVFRIEQGSFRIEQIRVRNTVKPVKNYIDFFGVNPQLYTALLDRRGHIVLRIEFVDDGQQKQAELNLNGRLDAINQREPIYETEITNVVREGNNYLEIRPITELNIPHLEVRVE